jgi:hypothetical protein
MTVVADAETRDTAARDVETRVERLSAVSTRRVIDPDADIIGTVGAGQILPDELLSVAGLDLELTPEQKATLSREEVASITQEGIRFEAVLEAGFALQIAGTVDVTDPRVTYLLHEIGEETRHQRLFVRLVQQLDPKARNPLAGPVFRLVSQIGVRRIVRMPALLYTLVLGGEEIPDLMQKLASEHPDTDPFLKDVNRYHRQEEARHLAFARLVLPEVWARAGIAERVAVRHVAPRIINGMFDMLVHPGVYETIGLPGWATWKAVRRSPRRIALRHEATRPIVRALLEAGALRRGRVPSAWRRLAGVDAEGQPQQ